MLADIPKLRGTDFDSGTECKSSDDGSVSEGQEMSKNSMTSSNKGSSQKKCVYEIGPPAWVKKEILSTNDRYFVSTIIFY